MIEQLYLKGVCHSTLTIEALGDHDNKGHTCSTDSGFQLLADSSHSSHSQHTSDMPWYF